MKTLIVYRTKYGATAACARMLADRIGAETALVDLAQERTRDVATADVILIGGSIYGGKIQREVTAFCERERESLLAGKVGLFICCLYRGERAEEQLAAAFPDWLHAHAFAREWLGGELHRRELSLADRLLVGSISGKAVGDLSLIRFSAVERLAGAARAFGVSR